MNPLLAKKKMDVNIESLSPEEQRLLRLYGTRGKLTPFKHINERKYFDSGDYAMNKAGNAELPVGSQHPNPENIPHPATSPVIAGGASNGGGLVSGIGMMAANNLQLKPILTNPASLAATAAGVGVGQQNQQQQQQQQVIAGADGRPQKAPVAGSPVKMSSFLNRETSANDVEKDMEGQGQGQQQQQQQQGLAGENALGAVGTEGSNQTKMSIRQ